MRARVLAVLAIAFVLQGVGSARGGDTGAFPWERVRGLQADEIRPELLDKAGAMLGQIASYGRCTQSVADCLRKDPPHTTAMRLARGVLLLTANQASRDEILKWIDQRKLMAHPETIHTFDLEGLEPLGDKDARVVIVEFSDFQCPFCARIAPALEKVVKESDGKARLYFKQFPIKGHLRALEAAKACVAASRFGKFWAYCGRLFEYRLDLSDENLIKLAGECGMDADKFKREMERDEVISRIADEKMEGLRNRVKGTPAVYINGKEMLIEPSAELIRDRIEEELDILHGRD